MGDLVEKRLMTKKRKKKIAKPKFHKNEEGVTHTRADAVKRVAHNDHDYYVFSLKDKVVHIVIMEEGV
jgi:hypothetical protein